MPPRFVIVLIILFWVGISAWTGWRFLEPYLRTDDPPPFVIDLAEESGQRTVFWDIKQNGRSVGDAESDVRQEDNGHFVISCRYKLLLGKSPLLQAKTEIVNRYHVGSDKKLTGLSAEVGLGTLLQADIIKGKIEGPIQDGLYKPSGEFEFLTGRSQKVRFDPLDLSGHPTVINPLHPVNRIAGLRPGRTWQVPVFDPLSLVSSAKLEGNSDPLVATILELVKSQQGAPRNRLLFAQVLPEPQFLQWRGRQELCWVIFYQGDELTARTWVRKDDDLVLKQEAKNGEDTLELIRIPQQ